MCNKEMFIFLLFVHYVIHSEETVSGGRCLMGAHMGMFDVCMEFCDFEISWGVGWEQLRTGVLLMMVGV